MTSSSVYSATGWRANWQ